MTRDTGFAVAGACAIVAAVQGMGPWWLQLITAAAGATCLYLARPVPLGSAADAARRGHAEGD